MRLSWSIREREFEILRDEVAEGASPDFTICKLNLKQRLRQAGNRGRGTNNFVANVPRDLETLLGSLLVIQIRIYCPSTTRRPT